MGNRRFGLGGFLLIASMLTPVSVLPLHAATKRPFIQKRYLRVISGGSVSVTFKKPNAAGNLIVAYVVWDNAGTVSITDTAGNAYDSAIGPTQATGDTSSAQVFYARNIAGGPNTVTATFATGITARGVLYIHEYAGLDRTDPLDGAVAASGSSLSMDSGDLATASTGDLLFAAGESNGKSIGRLTRGFKKRLGKYGNVTAEEAAAVAGSHDVTATQKGHGVGHAAGRVQDGREHDTAHGLPAEGRAHRPLPGRPERHAVPDHRRLAAGADGQPVGGGGGRVLRRPPGRRLQRRLDQPAVRHLHGRPCRTAAPTTASCRSRRRATSRRRTRATSRASTTCSQLAAQHGMTVLLDPAETGSCLSVLDSNGVAKSRDYGRYLGSRYRDVDNIVWMSGNDFQSWPNPGDDAVVQAVARGIHDTDDRHIHTVELDYQVSGSLDDPDLGAADPAERVVHLLPDLRAGAGRLRSPERAADVPGRGELRVRAQRRRRGHAEDPAAPGVLEPAQRRRRASSTATATRGRSSTAGRAISTRRARSRWRYVNFLFASRRWYDLIPDQNHTVVTAGYGTFADGGALGDNDYLTAARTPDGALVMAYMPTLRTITVDMSTLAARRVRVVVRPERTARSPRSPARRSRTPARAPSRRRGSNGAGDGDWVLVLEAHGGAAGHAGAVGADGTRRVRRLVDSQITVSWSASTDNVGGRRLPRLPRRRAHPDDARDVVHRHRPHAARPRTPTRSPPSTTRTTCRIRRHRSSSPRPRPGRPSFSRATPRRSRRRAWSPRPTPTPRRPATPTSSPSAGTTRASSITSVTDSAGQRLPPRRRDVPRQRPEPGDLLRGEHRRRARGRTR